MNDMNGKVCIVTGSNSGIGKETASALAEMGATVVMAVRNAERGENARAEIVERTGNTKTDLMICDLASIDSIRQFAEEFTKNCDRLDVLINNAGGAFHKRQVTVDGFERTLAVNHLGPFLLTHELLTVLKSSAPSRVINLTSGIHFSAEVDFDDLQKERKYKGMDAYGDAKLMVVMYTYELARRLEGTGVSVNVVHPGFAATNMGSNMGSLRYKIMFKMVRPLQISAKKGAETSVYVASSPELEGVTGKYFTKSQEQPSSELSYDEEAQKRLWAITEELLGLA
ncbi:MAG: SDR family oxidoreductase [Candidatus Thorarchaeota archaeon]|jgi:NAD(P)-dependent dehydrogenase (short-subunit alcohol dehydrogenase family)